MFLGVGVLAGTARIGVAGCHSPTRITWRAAVGREIENDILMAWRQSAVSRVCQADFHIIKCAPRYRITGYCTLVERRACNARPGPRIHKCLKRNCAAAPVLEGKSDG